MHQSDSKSIKQYLVEFDLPIPFPEDLFAMIPDQMEEVNHLFTCGKLLSYSLSLDRSRIWAIFLSSSESELISLIDHLPLSKYMDYDYTELMFHQSLRLLPAMSMN